MVVYHISWKIATGFQYFFAKNAKFIVFPYSPPNAVAHRRTLKNECAVLVNDASFYW
jgi:hypothetical protein